MTPLHWAVEKGHIDVVKVLLDLGASVKARNKVCLGIDILGACSIT